MTTPSSPRRSASPSSAKRAAQLVLAVGAVLSVAAAFGSVWFVRAGIAVALTAGMVAAYLLVREISAAVARGREETRAVANRHDQTLRAERQREREVLDVIDVRTGALKSTISDLRADLAHTRHELQVAELALAEQTVAFQARGELLEARSMAVDELRQQVARLESEVVSLQAQAQESEAELLALPRRFDRDARQIKRA